MRVFLATGPIAGEKRSFIVDDEDAWWVGDFNWQVDRAGYVTMRFTSNGERHRVAVHRIMLDAGEWEIVDHRDGNPLNNSRENLRTADATQSIANRVSRRGEDKPKGVWLHNGGPRWIAQIKGTDGRRISKTFDTEAEAADWYDQQARRTHGEFAVTARQD